MSETIINKSIIIKESVKQLWWRWTTHEGLITFFGPENSIELKENGQFEIYFLMENPYGLRGSEGCRILKYAPEKMLSFSWNAPPQFKEIREGGYKTTVVLKFKYLDDTHTEIELNHSGWLEGEQWVNVYDYFNSAWDRVFEYLAAAVEKSR